MSGHVGPLTFWTWSLFGLLRQRSHDTLKPALRTLPTGLSDWKKYDIKRCRVFVPIYTKECHEGMMEAIKFAMEQQKRILVVWHSGKFPFFFAANYKHGLPRVPRGGLPLLHCNCDVVKELDGVLTKVFKHEPQGCGRKLQLRSLATQKKHKHQCLPPLQGQRNKQPDCNLSQASPSEEVFVYMHLIGVCSVNRSA
ncbi:hypothetical protein HaLaN_15225 [Haematococcus lacustris]|uniref:Uncharacterized protein n=1 Tax=Haematococcus lacustris TaxID=44745 RepID=A0A699ZAH4_HAELA|nr:hypothetical protein HaLaN_15225 [Haematococcus lacustris]